MGVSAPDMAQAGMNTDLDAALRLITARLHIDTVDHAPVTPTFTHYLARLRVSVPATTLHSYNPYWRIVENAWADRYLDEPTPTEIEELVEAHRCRAQVRANSREGRGAVINMISAIRCLYRHAELDDLISAARNPATRITKPRGLPSPRHALTREQVIAVGQVASTTGNDPELDALIVRLHIETACRRGGILRLDTTDLEPEQCLILLREKGGTMRWQPISPLLMTRLLTHVDHRRGKAATTRVLRYRDGRPIGQGRYDYLRKRIHTHLPWAARMQITPHWIRHTTLTYVEREFGPAVAHAYAGHLDNTTYQGSTLTYTKAGIIEVAHALAALTGQPHPLARAPYQPLPSWEQRWQTATPHTNDRTRSRERAFLPANTVDIPLKFALDSLHGSAKSATVPQ